MSNLSEEEIALKLTEIKFKNYTYKDYSTYKDFEVIDFYEKTLKRLKEVKDE